MTHPAPAPVGAPPRAVRPPTAEEVERAATVVAGHLPPSPLLADPLARDGSLLLKLETFQPTGSFKVRGALTALAALPEDVAVVTASAGNHGLGVAWAAGRLGRQATVVVPGNASAAKVAALQRFPITLVQVGTSYDDAEAHAMELAARGAHYLSAYNDTAVIAGQGSLGHELDAQVSEHAGLPEGPLTVVCGVGGGGLAAGLGLWASRRPGVRVVGVEAAASTAVSAAVRAGHDVEVEVGPTLADGMAGGIEPGSATVGIIRDTVDALVTVTEEEIRAALRHLAQAYGLVAEGSGAVPVAAWLAGRVDAPGPVVAVLSGRNIALPSLTAALAATA